MIPGRIEVMHSKMGPRWACCIAITVALGCGSLQAGQASTPRVRTVQAMAVPGFIGVGLAEIDGERAKALKLTEVAGVEVTRVEEDSPAEKAGLQVGDVVLEYNGEKVESMAQFSRLVRETPPGREVKLRISRNGQTQDLTVKVGSRRPGGYMGGDVGMALPHIEIPPLPDIPRSYMSWRSTMLGVEAEAIDSQLAEYFGVKEGVLVRYVIKDTPADKAGLKAGDVIIKVDGSKVVTPGDVSSHIRASLRSKKTFPLVVVRDHKEMTVNVTIDAEHSGFNFYRWGARTIKL